ncbi:MAG: DNA recombination protein RmuC [Gammaproteobacteria bacterium]|jgi:DNA recombination protein RmuC|nr:DNA recombination protein RmuC [Gammaproteobacteria bacterium]|tara:strand:+ start:1464 stop:2339 length:876 start_codon:yes stop_codon:yes gene_type:complete
MTEIALLIIGLVVGLALGYFLGKSKKLKSSDLSQQSGLATQISEMKGEIKGIFTEIEKSRDRSEDKRDAKLQDMSNTIDSFNRTISGTKTRGMVGESILKEALKNSIKAGVVKTELKIGSKNVEFAWDLGDGKYIPIDSKLPDIVPLVSQYENSKNTEEQKLLSKKIKDKVAKEILNIQKYQNQTNTIDNCILVIPPSILDMSPELVGIGKDSNVFVCSYKDVFPIAHILEEQYRRFNEEGDIGEYKKTIKQLDSILDKVISKTETLDRAIKQISNANDEIKDEVAKGKRL